MTLCAFCLRVVALIFVLGVLPTHFSSAAVPKSSFPPVEFVPRRNSARR